jgi:hypothetical protein
MPKYKNGKVKQSRFKAQDLVRTRGHLDFQIFFDKGVS